MVAGRPSPARRGSGGEISGSGGLAVAAWRRRRPVRIGRWRTDGGGSLQPEKPAAAQTAQPSGTPLNRTLISLLPRERKRTMREQVKQQSRLHATQKACRCPALQRPCSMARPPEETTMTVSSVLLSNAVPVACRAFRAHPPCPSRSRSRAALWHAGGSRPCGASPFRPDRRRNLRT
jgi:hypothetical protein